MKNTHNSVRDAMDFMAELYNQANADATVANITNDQKEECHIVADAFAMAFAHLHRHFNPKIISGIMGISQERQEAQMISLSRAQLADIYHKTLAVAHPKDTVHLFYDANQINAFVMDEKLTIVPLHTSNTPQNEQYK